MDGKKVDEKNFLSLLKIDSPEFTSVKKGKVKILTADFPLESQPESSKRIYLNLFSIDFQGLDCLYLEGFKPFKSVLLKIQKHFDYLDLPTTKCTECDCSNLSRCIKKNAILLKLLSETVRRGVYEILESQQFFKLESTKTPSLSEFEDKSVGRLHLIGVADISNYFDYNNQDIQDDNYTESSYSSLFSNCPTNHKSMRSFLVRIFAKFTVEQRLGWIKHLEKRAKIETEANHCLRLIMLYAAQIKDIPNDKELVWAISMAKIFYNEADYQIMQEFYRKEVELVEGLVTNHILRMWNSVCRNPGFFLMNSPTYQFKMAFVYIMELCHLHRSASSRESRIQIPALSSAFDHLTDSQDEILKMFNFQTESSCHSAYKQAVLCRGLVFTDSSKTMLTRSLDDRLKFINDYLIGFMMVVQRFITPICFPMDMPRDLLLERFPRKMRIGNTNIDRPNIRDTVVVLNELMFAVDLAVANISKNSPLFVKRVFDKKTFGPFMANFDSKLNNYQETILNYFVRSVITAQVMFRRALHTINYSLLVKTGFEKEPEWHLIKKYESHIFPTKFKLNKWNWEWVPSGLWSKSETSEPKPSTSGPKNKKNNNKKKNRK